MTKISLPNLFFQQHFKLKPNLFLSTCLTLLLIFVYMLSVKISIPFVNEAVIKEYFNTHAYGTDSITRISILSLGVMPYVSACLLVEILSLIVPVLKKYRKGDLKGRSRLKVIALIVTLFLGILQGTGVINGLKKLTLSNGDRLLNIGDNLELALLIAMLVGGVYFLILICELISRYGIGNGISLIILTGICTDYYAQFNRNISIVDELGIVVFILSFCALFILAFATVFLLTTKTPVKIRHRSKTGFMNVFHFNCCPSAGIALVYANSILMIPATITHSFDTGSEWVHMFTPGSIFYQMVNVVFIFIFSYLFAWAFFHPKRRLQKLQKFGWKFPSNKMTAAHELLKRLFIYNLPWTLFLCLLAIMPHILITSFNVPFYIGGASIPIAVAISLDIRDRFRFGMATQQKPVKIAQFNDVYDAAMIKSFLFAEGIPCHLQGYYHRHLLYFFGPYIEMILIVSNSKKTHAIELLNQYFGGLGISITNETNII